MIVYLQFSQNGEGHSTRTRPEIENSLTRIRYNLWELGTKNINFILCKFQNTLIFKHNTNLWNWHRMKFMFLSLILANCTLFSSQFLQIIPYSRLTRSRTRISFSCYDPSHIFSLLMMQSFSYVSKLGTREWALFVCQNGKYFLHVKLAGATF